MSAPLLTFRQLSVSFAAENSACGRYRRYRLPFMLARPSGSSANPARKSVTAMALMGLLPPQAARIDSGEILFDGQDLLRLKARNMADLRGNQLAMIFQEPMTALNPVLTIGEQLCEPLIRHRAKRPKPPGATPPAC